MTEGVTALSKKELDRFPIIRVVVGKELLQREATQRPGLSIR